MNKIVIAGAFFLLAAVGFTTLPVSRFYAPVLTLPAGFSSTLVADSLGKVRHIDVNSQGGIYVKLSVLKDGKGMYYLTDLNKDGIIDKKTTFADYPGTGVKIKGNYLYSTSNSSVYRYQLNNKGEVINPDKPELIVDGLLDKKRDNSKSIALDDQNNLYVTIGSYSDACREGNTGKGMPGCPILDSAGGIWLFKANKPNQSFKDGVRYATGLKNSVGIDWNPTTKTLFATHHGRGAFADKFPEKFTAQQNADLPAETIYELKKGVDAGWPFTYYDQFQKKNILAPEYGGDGKIEGDKKYINPAIAFPAHLAPNDLLFYTGNMFPARYKNGAFVVFHAKSTELKKGYFVAFVPFVNGKPSGDWEVFAENFTGPTGPVQYRPMGLAQGPDGALYIADDVKGAIFKITYKK
ncbi:MAG TPA: sorbosone dehydrogenase [Sphingobacteriaceae bacterium]|nr:sorbosone dehydrogenase [Sphingobacteriaceae bacterium]